MAGVTGGGPTPADEGGDPACWAREFEAEIFGEPGPGPIEDDPTAYFAARGWEVAIDERELYAEHMAQGDPGRASSFVEGRLYTVVHLVSGGRVTAPGYGVGESRDEALRSALRRYRSEQG